MMRTKMLLVGLITCLAACGGEDEGADGVQALASGEDTLAVAMRGAQPGSATSSSFQATTRGAIDLSVDGHDAVSGAKYDRFHINMASTRHQDGPPVVVIAFGRPGGAPASPGTYALGIPNAFRGSVEVYGDVQREFDITSGELEITGSRDGGLTGRFTFTAREVTEDYTSTAAQVEVDGTFRTRPVD
jgi:hypothetical protein